VIYSDITLVGETLLSQGTSLVRLLPGEYTTRTANPQLVQILKSTTAGNLTQFPGFNLSSFNPLPLNISLLAGLVLYSYSLYSGQPTFSPLPSTQMNASLPLPASYLALSDNVWMALTSGSNNNSIIFWQAVPDVSQLPSAASQPLALVDIQSYTCSPACASSAVCSTSRNAIVLLVSQVPPVRSVPKDSSVQPVNLVLCNAKHDVIRVYRDQANA
jgi:hypothetical protein